MPAYLAPLLAQLIPVVAPYVLEFLQWGLGKMGVNLPAGVLPAANAALGAAVGQAASGDPTTGALIAHVVRSGIKHEVPNAK